MTQKKKNTPKKAAKVEETPVVEEVKAEETVVVEKPIVAPKAKAKKVDSFDPLTVSQSTRRVTFEWSKGEKSGTKETMSDNLAEIFEGRSLGKKVK